MDILANYDSEDDECKTEQKAEEANINNASKSVNTAAGSTEISRPLSKKKRKLDLSFLPSEIVNALTRGDSTKDSDDEGEVDPKIKANKPETSSLSTCKLLSLLPPPATMTKQLDSNRIVEKPENLHHASDSASISYSTDSKPKSNFNFQYTVQDDRKSVNSSVEKKNEYKESQSYFLTQSAKINFNAQSSLICNPLYSMEDDSQSPWSGSTKPVGSLVGPMQAQASTFMHAGGSSSSNFSNSSVIGQAGKLTNKKKRDRELEQQLLSGNLAALPDDAPTMEMNANHQWDATKYTDQQQREAMIFKEFGVTQQKNLAQPTRQQNRKHQLSSLAIKAAQVELSMLDARGSRMKTKSETQGKYGW